MDRDCGGAVPADVGDRPRGGAREPGGPDFGCLLKLQHDFSQAGEPLDLFFLGPEDA